MDLDDGAPAQVPRPNRFVPRSSKAKPKPKSSPIVKQEPPKPVPKPEPQNQELKPKREELDSLILEKKEEGGEREGAPKTDGSNGGLKMETDEGPIDDDPMEEDEPEDIVVREIDVFFNPHIDENSLLYVLQYPLRTWWRPYELENRCEEVRLKPATSEMEIDLSLDFDSRNYDENCADRLKFTKQTLATTWKPPRTSGAGYAVGVLKGNKLHLNPVNKVVQLRPSLEHLKSGGSKKNSIAGDAEVRVKLEEAKQDRHLGPSKNQNNLKGSSTTEDEQSWVPLQFHGLESEFSARYLRRMVVEASSPIQFTMSPYDYLNFLCPRKCKGSSRRSLLSLPLEERIKKLLFEDPVVRPFSDLKKYFAPDHTVEELLDVLQSNAQLLLASGVWVAKTTLVCPSKNDKALGLNEKRDHIARQTARNYILNLFRKSPVISRSQIDLLPQTHKTYVFESLERLAASTPSSQDWKLKASSDMSFLELYPEIVKSQQQKWEDMEEKLAKALNKSTTIRIAKG